MVKVMEKKEYSVVEFIQYLKDKPYINLYKADRLAEIDMRRERYYYAVAAFMRKDGKLTYTSVTSSVKGEEKDIEFYPIMDLITDVEEKFEDDMVSGTTIIHGVTEISKEDYEAYNERIAKINKKEG